MMELKNLIDDYHRWLRDKTTLKPIHGDWNEITTPFLDRHNDYIQIFAKLSEDNILLTDDGYTLNDLEISGVSIDSPKRTELLRMALNGFGIKREGQALTVHATKGNFPLRKHNLIQGMLAINDLFYVASPHVSSLFYEDVANWLDDSDIRYLPRVKFAGTTGYDHMFDFVIPKSRQKPERVIRALNSPTRDKAESFAFAWHDTKDARDGAATAVAMVNDNERPIPGSVREALSAYDITVIPWSERANIQRELAA